jgi:hypothetical protein
MNTRKRKTPDSESDASAQKKIKKPYSWDGHEETLHVLSSKDIEPSTKVIGFDMVLFYKNKKKRTTL